VSLVEEEKKELKAAASEIGMEWQRYSQEEGWVLLPAASIIVPGTFICSN